MAQIKTANGTGKAQQRYRPYGVWLMLVVVLLSTSAIRLRLLQVPLERDEGEYAYAGQLILQGVAPYDQIYNMKMPGIYAAYALILAVFGQTHIAIHLGLLILNLATIFLVFLLGRKLFNTRIGGFAAAAFALLSLGRYVQGVFANAEHFVILVALAGILLLVHAVQGQKWLPLISSAVLLGVTFLMKQNGAAFILFAAGYLIFCELRRRPLSWKLFAAKCTLFLIGVLLPFLITCWILWRAGVFEKFWFWTFDYARQYASAVPPLQGLKYLQMRVLPIAGSAILIWIAAGIGLISVFVKKTFRYHAVFMAGFFLLSFAAVCPGLYFRPHYFVLLLPALALLAGIGADCLCDILNQHRSLIVARVIPIFLALGVLFHTLYQQRDFFFIMSPNMAARATYGLNPFVESPEIGRFIRENSSEDDRIAVIGSEPQIYFYSKRRAATGYIYTYEMMKNHSYALKMQKEMIEQIEAAKPKFLVLVSVSSSWSIRPESEKMILTWFEEYQRKFYSQVGIIDILGPDWTVYRWDEAVRDYSPRSGYWLAVYQRN